MARLTKDFKEYLQARLQTPEAVAGYLNAVLEENDSSAFLLALRYVTDTQNVAKVAAAAELNRESLYRMLSDQGNPRLSSMLALLGAMGLRLSVHPLSREEMAANQQGELRGGLALVSLGKGYIARLEDQYDDHDTDSNKRVAA